MLVACLAGRPDWFGVIFVRKLAESRHEAWICQANQSQ